MSDQKDLKPIHSALNKSDNTLILLPKDPSHDAVASALSLYLSIKKKFKNTQILCPTKMIVEHSRLVGLDKVKNKAGNKNLVISFNYVKDKVEKVNYNITGDNLNVIVHTKKGSKPLDPKNASYSHSGMRADLIFIIGADSFTDLADIYQDNKKIIENAYLIGINKNSPNNPFTQTTISDENSGSLSEITFWLIEQLELEVDNDVASNLISGIDRATNKFSSPTTPASSFLTAGKLITLGAKRNYPPKRPINPNIPTSNPQTAPANLPSTMQEPMSTKQSEKNQPLDEQVLASDKDKPKEWFEPKIYRGSTKI